MQVPSDDEMGQIYFDVQPDAEDAAEAKAAEAAEDTEDAKTVQLARKRKKVLESLKDKLVEIQSTDSEPEQAEHSSSSACLLNTELERNVRHKKEKLSQEPVRVADAMAAADAEAEGNLRCKKETFSLCFAFRLQALGLRGLSSKLWQEPEGNLRGKKETFIVCVLRLVCKLWDSRDSKLCYRSPSGLLMSRLRMLKRSAICVARRRSLVGVCFFCKLYRTPGFRSCGIGAPAGG